MNSITILLLFLLRYFMILRLLFYGLKLYIVDSFTLSLHFLVLLYVNMLLWQH